MEHTMVPLTDKTRSLADAAALGAQRGTHAGLQPLRPLVLFGFESCPYCRMVREALEELGVPYVSRPAPRGSSFRTDLRARGGKEQVPYLADPNNGEEMYESRDIVTHVSARYGDGAPSRHDARHAAPAGARRAGLEALPPWDLSPGADAGGGAALVLYNLEGDNGCRRVRRELERLELAHLVLSVPEGSSHRDTLAQRVGEVSIPYLIDRQRGVERSGAEAILAHLAAVQEGT